MGDRGLEPLTSCVSRKWSERLSWNFRGFWVVGRMKQVEWKSPLLTFLIERHGGTVLGSSRAEHQQWCVDIDRQIASCESTGHRQLSPMATGVDVDSIALEIVQRIVSGKADDRLSWLEDRRVKVQVSKIFPDASGYKQTVHGRRKRLREALIEILSTKGWVHLGRNTFGQLKTQGL
jgi:hypothetical protein